MESNCFFEITGIRSSGRIAFGWNVSPTKHAHLVCMIFSSSSRSKKSLLAELWKDKRPLRLMGVALTNVTKDTSAQQLSLFDEPNWQIKQEKRERLDKTVSAIRNKFGFDAIQRGALINSDYGVGRKYKGKSESEREPEE